MAAPIPLQGAIEFTLPRPQAGRVGRLESTSEKVRRVMKRIAAGYPESMRGDQLDDVERVAFHVEQVHRPGARLADLGGGIGLFSPACAALGMRTWLVDDFQDSVNHEHPIDELGIHAGYGVRVVASDVRHPRRAAASAMPFKVKRMATSARLVRVPTLGISTSPAPREPTMAPKVLEK